ncbi:MAG TPA: AAA family ATPase [Candidatus Saccharimonadales bacterium]|nr:AAA family ATPase [Candidatus Saccharimonadales bacterium]
MKDTPIILAFVGMPGSGKDTCTDYVAKEHQTPILHFGNMVYEEVQRRGLDIVTHEKAVREDMRAKGGLAVLAERVADKAQQYLAEGKTRIVLNGLYSWSEYKHLRELFGEQFVCVALAAPRALRYQRILSRNHTTDTHRKYTVEQVKEREYAEIENLEKGGPIAIADYTLLNSKTPDNLYRQLDELLDHIGF